jgi:hypothetical protein
LALLRYDSGRASYFEVLEAQQQYFVGAYDLARTERDELLAVVSLYKALGGGWNADAPGMPPPTTTLVSTDLAAAEADVKALTHVEITPSAGDAKLSPAHAVQ